MRKLWYSLVLLLFSIGGYCMFYGFQMHKDSCEDGWGAAAKYAHMSYKKRDDMPIVRQGEIRVSEQQLFTSGLLGCSAVGFTHGKKNFLAHIDGTVSVDAIKDAISRNFKVEELLQDDNLTILMWSGMVSVIPPKTIAAALQSLGLYEKLIDMTSMDEVGPMTEVGVDTDGSFCEQARPRAVEVKKAYPPLLIGNIINPNVLELSKVFAKQAELAPIELPPGSQGSLEAWNQWLQKYFLRVAGKDHQDIATDQKHPLHHQMLPLFRNLGLVDAVLPSRKQFDVIAIFGGTPVDTRERMYHVVKLWQEGVRADHIIYINGRRKLHPLELTQHGLDTENKDTPSQPDWVTPKDIPLFQHEMAAVIWEQLVPKNSELFAKFQILTIDPPVGKSRATTEDTISALIDRNTSMTSCLFVSNAPYGPYQGETVNNVLDEKGAKDLVTETTSSKLTRDLTTAPFLDTLARRAYTLNAIEQRHDLKQKLKQ